ncbi:hypothetical protein BsWGS_01203 [Bradybaena similaris]
MTEARVSRETQLRIEEYDSRMPSIASSADRESYSAASTVIGTSWDPTFAAIVHEIEAAIQLGIDPTLCSKGSSGSYLVKDTEKKILGIFKPKDEEPYGHMNPKWTKWLHKHCSPCCFGRGCLLPNQGYLSEAGACVVDRKLGLYIVPQTHVIRLASPAFNYKALDRAVLATKQSIFESVPALGKRFNTVHLPRKVGSLQLFVRGYQDADIWLRKFDADPLRGEAAEDFRLLFERLTVLDYIIRNTDRGNDNWLIRYEPETPKDVKPARESLNRGNYSSLKSALHHLPMYSKDAASDNHHDTNLPIDDVIVARKPEIFIAAIDNGLAFPFKHPDEWRTYPYHWAWLPQAKVPYSKNIQDLLLPKLTDKMFVQGLHNDLRILFKIDKDFSNRKFEQQMAVMRGQIANVIKALQEQKCPLELVQMPVLTIEYKHKITSRRNSDNDEFTERVNVTRPMFSCC